MNARDAAEKLRPSFHLEQMPVEDRHEVKFVEDVATELGIAHTAFNLHQVADALDAANIHQDSNEFPKMLFSRQHHAAEGVEASVYDPRHDYVYTHVADEEQAGKLGSGWVENPAELPPRGDIPINAPDTVAPPVVRGSTPPVQPVPLESAPVIE